MFRKVLLSFVRVKQIIFSKLRIRLTSDDKCWIRSWTRQCVNESLKRRLKNGFYIIQVVIGRYFWRPSTVYRLLEPLKWFSGWGKI